MIGRVLFWSLATVISAAALLLYWLGLRRGSQVLAAVLTLGVFGCRSGASSAGTPAAPQTPAREDPTSSRKPDPMPEPAAEAAAPAFPVDLEALGATSEWQTLRSLWQRLDRSSKARTGVLRGPPGHQEVGTDLDEVKARLEALVARRLLGSESALALESLFRQRDRFLSGACFRMMMASHMGPSPADKANCYSAENLEERVSALLRLRAAGKVDVGEMTAALEDVVGNAAQLAVVSSVSQTAGPFYAVPGADSAEGVLSAVRTSLDAELPEGDPSRRRLEAKLTALEQELPALRILARDLAR